MAAWVLNAFTDSLPSVVPIFLLGAGLYARAAWSDPEGGGDGDIPAAVPNPSDPNWIGVTAAVAASVPVTLALGVLAALAVVFVVLAAIGAVAWFFLRESKPIVRGLNSHYTADGSEKVSYATAQDAQAAADLMAMKEGLPMSTYLCEKGGHFHFGHDR